MAGPCIVNKNKTSPFLTTKARTNLMHSIGQIQGVATTLCQGSDLDVAANLLMESANRIQTIVESWIGTTTESSLSQKLNAPITVLDLPGNIQWRLIYTAEAKTLRELVQMSERDLRRIRWIGDVAIGRIKDALAGVDLSLGMT